MGVSWLLRRVAEIGTVLDTLLQLVAFILKDTIAAILTTGECLSQRRWWHRLDTSEVWMVQNCQIRVVPKTWWHKHPTDLLSYITLVCNAGQKMSRQATHHVSSTAMCYSPDTPSGQQHTPGGSPAETVCGCRGHLILCVLLPKISGASSGLAT